MGNFLITAQKHNKLYHSYRMPRSLRIFTMSIEVLSHQVYMHHIDQDIEQNYQNA